MFVPLSFFSYSPITVYFLVADILHRVEASEESGVVMTSVDVKYATLSPFKCQTKIILVFALCD